MNVELQSSALEDLTWFAKREPRLLKRILQIIEDTRRSPFDGIGKPEPLKGELSGWWSRRIDREHRLVYRVVGNGAAQRIQIIQCRKHY
ncbi:MAG: addiction module protein [Hyphobacterium sp.]|nr:MAG: addiction module protein [Hyphobacterium sp.]